MDSAKRHQIIFIYERDQWEERGPVPTKAKDSVQHKVAPLAARNQMGYRGLKPERAENVLDS